MSPKSLMFGLLFSLSGVVMAQDEIRIPAYDDQVPPPPAEGAALKPRAVPAIWTVSEGTEAVLVEDHRVPEVVLVVEIPVGLHSPWLDAQHVVEAWELQMYDAEGALRARADALAADLYLYCSARTCNLEVVTSMRRSRSCKTCSRTRATTRPSSNVPIKAARSAGRVLRLTPTGGSSRPPPSSSSPRATRACSGM